jgi:hypothetical protein
MSTNNNSADLLMLKGFARGNKEVIIKLIHVFLRNTPDMMAELEKNILDQDREHMRLMVHKLISQFIFMNFDAGEQILLKLKAGYESTESKDDLISHLNDLHLECNAFYETLNHELNRLQ